jgi:Coenzyme PQQ synthesis protein D (PqqD)
MNVSFDTRISVSTDLLVSKVADEMVILNYSNETYYGLNRIGSRVWDSLTKGNSILDTYEILRSEFKVSKEKLLRDILHLVEQLLKQGLVRVTAN